jgi:hypothetical protein
VLKQTFFGINQIAALAITGFHYGNGVRINALLLVAITTEAAVSWWRFHLGSDRLLTQSGYI